MQYLLSWLSTKLRSTNCFAYTRVGIVLSRAVSRMLPLFSNQPCRVMNIWKLYNPPEDPLIDPLGSVKKGGWVGGCLYCVQCCVLGAVHAGRCMYDWKDPALT